MKTLENVRVTVTRGTRVRVLTAAVAAPLFIVCVLYLNGFWFAVLTGLFVLVGAWEWTHLSGYAETPLKVLAAAVVVVLMVVGYLYRDVVARPTLVASCAAWLAVGVLLFHRRALAPLLWPKPARWLCGAAALIPAWLAVGLLQSLEPAAALMLFVLIWMADSGAYFAGRRFGRHKLAPAISPGKTVEGLYGAVAAAFVVAALFSKYWGFDVHRWAALTAWSVGVIVASVFGDLFESNWKRTAELKDSGAVFPGHGGVLDRIDSILAAAPFFALGWLWWFGSEGP